MTELGFNHQIAKLRNIFGEKGFHPDRVAIIARRLKILTDEDFADICMDVIANLNNPPTLKDFLKIGEPLLHLRREEQNERDRRELENTPRCTSCEGDGYLSAIKVHQGHRYSYSFRCPLESCLAARLFVPPNYPRWSTDYEPEYKRRTE